MRRLPLAIIALLFAIGILLTLAQIPKPVVEGRIYRIRSTYTFINEGMDPWVLSPEDRRVYLFMNTTFQEVTIEKISHPITLVSRDEDGNPYGTIEFEKPTVDPDGNLTYYVEFRASRRDLQPLILEGEPETLEDIPKDVKTKYLFGGDGWQTDDPELRELAEAEAKGDVAVLNVVLNYVRWIKANIRYAYGQEVPSYPNETYRKKMGDCDDQAILLITLCRIYGIPAYLQIGCIYKPSQPLRELSLWGGHLIYRYERIAWHGWAMIYIPPWGWVPFDLTHMLAEPITAINNSALYNREVIVYMNISNSDYVGETRRVRRMMEEGKFKVEVEDEMTLLDDSESMIAFAPSIPSTGNSRRHISGRYEKIAHKEFHRKLPESKSPGEPRSRINFNNSPSYRFTKGR